MKAFSNGLVFTGSSFIQGQSILAEDGIIAGIVSPDEVPDHAEKIDLGGGYLIPGFIDLQLYGGNEMLFGENPSVDALSATYQYSLRGGATQILPTIATNSFDKFFEAIDAVQSYRAKRLPGVLGLHIEGPFINPLKKGAHVEAYIQKPTVDSVRKLLDRGKGIIRIITLAPEVCSEEIIRLILDHGVIISAGHSNATYQEAEAAFQKGIPLATHLFNAMSPLQHRAPGLVGAIFNSTEVMASVIADGHHVDFPVIRIAKDIMKERLFLITDAVTENKSGLYPHHLQGDKYVVADGTLSGSALTMMKAVKNCIQHLNIPMEESFRMASLYPAKAIGLDHTIGKIEKGYQADLLWLDTSLKIKAIHTHDSLTVF